MVFFETLLIFFSETFLETPTNAWIALMQRIVPQNKFSHKIRSTLKSIVTFFCFLLFTTMLIGIGLLINNHPNTFPIGILCTVIPIAISIFQISAVSIVKAIQRKKEKKQRKKRRAENMLRSSKNK